MQMEPQEPHLGSSQRRLQLSDDTPAALQLSLRLHAG